jgi:hypothetical protein
MALEDSHTELRDAGITTLGAMPLLAVRHGVPPSFPAGAGHPARGIGGVRGDWQRFQSGFAALSPAGHVTLTITLRRDRDQIEGIFMESAG